jgi:hypothetical protein
LADHLHAMLSAQLDDRSVDVYDVMLERAEALLAELLALGCAQRDRALDLLAVDALVTYAFEAAAESPETLGDRAGAAMSSLAMLATASPSA